MPIKYATTRAWTWRYARTGHVLLIALLPGCGGAIDEQSEQEPPPFVMNVHASVEQDAGAAVHTCMPVPDAGWVCSD